MSALNDRTPKLFTCKINKSRDKHKLFMRLAGRYQVCIDLIGMTCIVILKD